MFFSCCFEASLLRSEASKLVAWRGQNEKNEQNPL
jgi:hypothetical protein